MAPLKFLAVHFSHDVGRILCYGLCLRKAILTTNM